MENSAEELAKILCTKRRQVGKYSRVLNLLKEMPILDKKTLGWDSDCLHRFLRRLHSSTENGEWQKIIDALLDHGYNVNNQDLQGCTPLLSYLNNLFLDLHQLDRKKGEVSAVDVVRKLLDCGANVNKASHDGNTPLYVSVSMLDIEITTMILAAGGNVESVVGGSVLYALGKACKNDSDVIQSKEMYMLLQEKVNVQQQCVDGSMIIHYAASTCTGMFLDLILDLTKSSGIQETDGLGRTILHHAVRNLCKHMVLKDCMDNLDVNAKDNNLHTPLHLACFDQQIEAALILLRKRNANPNVEDRIGVRPMHLCCPPLKFANPYSYKADVEDFKMSLTLIQELCKLKADINATDKFGSTVLHYVAFTGCPASTIKFLLEAGVNKDLRDENDFSAAHVAAQQCHWDIVELLEGNRQTSNMPCSDLNPGQSTMDGMEKYTQSVRDFLRSSTNIDKIVDVASLIDTGLHSTRRGLETNEYVCQRMEEYFQSVVEEMAILDSRFRGKLVCSGSTYEGAKIGNPNEFDFMVELIGFNELALDYSHLEEKPGFVELLVGGDSDPRFDDFLIEGKLDGKAILSRFKLLTWQAMCKVNQKENNHIYCPHEDWFSRMYPPMSWLALPDDSVSSRKLQGVSLVWIGSTYKYMEVSVDLNPVIFLNKWPDKFRLKSFLLSNLPTEGIYVIPKGNITRGNTFPWRISFSHIETKMFRDMPKSALEAYRLVKAIREPPITPIITNSQDEKKRCVLEFSLTIDLCQTNDSASMSEDRPNVNELLRFPEKRPTHHFEVDPSKELVTFYLKSLFVAELDKFAAETTWPREITTHEKVKKI